MRFNDVLSQFDLFSNVISQRSENENGVWLSGLDVLAADALSPPAVPFEAPEVVCYLAAWSGRGHTPCPDPASRWRPEPGRGRAGAA